MIHRPGEMDYVFHSSGRIAKNEEKKEYLKPPMDTNFHEFYTDVRVSIVFLRDHSC